MVLILVHIYDHIAFEKYVSLVFFLSFYSLAKIRQTKLELRNDCHFRTNKWFTKKCQMLQCNAAMKVTNEKTGIFSFYLHNMNKKF